MQNTSKLLGLITASLIAGTAAASAQGYDWNGPRAYYPDVAGPYGALNGTNHPTPSSTQGDVGPDGNNNGTLTGGYRW